jgi:hypothetical protein
MNEECCNHNCNQGRDCPLRKRNLSEEITEGFKALETMRTLTDEEILDLIVNKVTDADMIRQALKKASEK